MSENMVERVAIAMAGDFWDLLRPNGIDAQDPGKEDYIALARVAISAMRTPTEGMLDRAREAPRSHIKRYQAMIDSALAELPMSVQL